MIARLAALCALVAVGCSAPSPVVEVRTQQEYDHVFEIRQGRQVVSRVLGTWSGIETTQWGNGMVCIYVRHYVVAREGSFVTATACGPRVSATMVQP